MHDAPPTVHSVAEAYLYLLVAPCERCRKGPFRHTRDLALDGSPPGAWSIDARCAACHEPRCFRFDIDPPPTREEARSSRINPTHEPSAAIDLLGWLTLFQTLIEKADAATDRQTARGLAFEAAQCLDEALKFYDPGDELPREAAFFTPASRRRFREHPHFFNRSRWRDRRLKLPEIDWQQRLSDARPAGKPWWRFWA